MSGQTVCCVVIREIEERNDHEYVYSHCGPYVFSSEKAAESFMCETLVPQLEEALFDEPPFPSPNKYSHWYDGKSIREEFRYNYGVLEHMATTVLRSHMNWTIFKCVVDEELSTFKRQKI